MSLSINNNITALNAWRNLKTTDMRMSKTMEKLSSGLRINRAADDPAGLVISEKMRAQLVGLDAAAKNAEKAINMIQTAEAALDQVQKLLDKMRQLTVDSMNLGVNDEAMLKANQDELDEAIVSVTRIAQYTQFGTKKLLDGSLGNEVTIYDPTKLDSATLNGSNISVALEGNFDLVLDQIASRGFVSLQLGSTAGGLSNVSTDGTLDAAASLTLNGVKITFATGDNIADGINAVKDQTGVSAKVSTNKLYLYTTDYGNEAQITFVAASGELNGGGVTETDVGQDAEARLLFTDTSGNTITISFADTANNVGLTLSDGNGNVITLDETFATATANSGATATDVGALDANKVVFQVGANIQQSVELTIQSVEADQLGGGVSSTYTSLNALRSGVVETNGVLRTANQSSLEEALQVIDKAIDQISDLRGQLGAAQADNLQVQLDRIRVAYENLQASESTIRDTDMTLEMANFTKYQIMMQAGTAMLAQANQIPNNILQLLR